MQIKIDFIKDAIKWSDAKKKSKPTSIVFMVQKLRYFFSVSAIYVSAQQIYSNNEFV